MASSTAVTSCKPTSMELNSFYNALQEGGKPVTLSTVPAKFSDSHVPLQSEVSVCLHHSATVQGRIPRLALPGFVAKM